MAGTTPVKMYGVGRACDRNFYPFNPRIASPHLRVTAGPWALDQALSTQTCVFAKNLIAWPFLTPARWRVAGSGKSGSTA